MLPTGLSMLWEDVDARAALRERFGFDDVGGAASWCASVLRLRWGIDAGECTRIVVSGRNVIAWITTSRGPVIVKWSAAPDSFARLEASTRLLHALGEHHAPVAAPIPDRNGDVRPRVAGPRGELSVAVLPEIDGDWLDVGDPVAVHAAGVALARIHGALEVVPVDRAELPRFDDPRAEVERWLRDDAPVGVDRARIGELLVAAPLLDRPVQPVHNDFRAANVLTRGSDVVAVLDFDEVIVAPPVFDLAKAPVYLATQFTDWGPTSPAVRERFRAGYESVRPLSDAEAAWFDVVVLWLGARAGWAGSV